jgi:predicted DNA-binding transcriptional regulator AlpA
MQKPQARRPHDADDAHDAEIRTSDRHDPYNLGCEEPLMASPQMLKLPEVLTEIGMSRAAFYRMRARGQAPRLVKLPNGHLRVRRSDLDDWLSSLDSPAY